MTVLTEYATALAPLGHRWLRGAVKLPPPGFALDACRLRLWAIAGGARQGADADSTDAGITPREPAAAYLLRLGRNDEPTWGPVGAALAAAGLPAALLGPRSGGPAYRLVGRRRLARLAELIGDPPHGAPPGAWP